jgi:heterodisulfide reductase subunit A-like polyferredoxin
VLVLGGGNVAMDCARTAVRLGAEVHLACLEPREKMLCHPEEAAAAEEEGVTIHASRTFLRVADDGTGRAAGVECARVSGFEFDHEGRLHVETAPGSEHLLEADTVIFSVGQRAGLAFVPEDTGVGVTRKRTIAINPNTMAATRKGVFAAGDSVSGTAFVIEAVASGHRAAESIERYLRGEDLERPPKPVLPVVKFTRPELLERASLGEIDPGNRVPLRELPATERAGSFAEVDLGYTDEAARAEAARCLTCATCSECLACQLACGRQAIDHDLPESFRELAVGAVVLAPGYEAYDARLSQEYGLGRFANVVTALQFERLLSASGPTHGHVQRPGDGRTPRKIAFLQCVGSRDQKHDYCSSVCCMYAAKEAIMAVEHEPGTEVAVFFMDARSFSKGYEEYYRRAREKYGVRYERCRVSRLLEDPGTGDLRLRTVRDGKVREESFDLVVLSVGMEISPSVRELGKRLGIQLDEYGFCHTALFTPLETSRPGIFAAGPFREPKDIPETIVEASGAAAKAASLLAAARGTLTRTPEFPPERDVSGEDARVGVFICHCGSNIGGFLDVPAVAEYARTLPGVVHAEANLYTCSQDTVRHITETAVEQNLNRVVVASCSPRTHEPLFQDASRAAGLNPALFEMANIRNQCSWVHSTDWEAATRKAMSLVRGAVARASRLLPVQALAFPVRKAALVLGGGASGMSAALELADQGFRVHLVERSPKLGGNLRRVRYLESGKRPEEFLRALISRTRGHPNVEVHLEAELRETEGFQGNFRSTLSASTGTQVVEHGVTIVATGAREYRGSEYGLGTRPDVVTTLDFEEFLYRKAGGVGCNGSYELAALPLPDRVAMILCVGPGERYCARTCCTTALKNALLLKELNPSAEVTLLYRDIRTYGFKERLYTEARRRGVLFRRYEPPHRPELSVEWSSLRLDYVDAGTGKKATLRPDMLVLAEPLVPNADNHELATRLKAPLDADGFFLEAHVKLRPVDFQTNGLYLAGLAHYPKLLSESIAQAQAAAARAATILSKEEILSDGIVAQVDAAACAGCLTCVRACPYSVPKIQPDLAGAGGVAGAAYIEPATCRGCGVCAGECPAKAIQLAHFTDAQVLSMVDTFFSQPVPYHGARHREAPSGGV